MARGSDASGFEGVFRSPAPPLLSDCGPLLGAIFSPVGQAVRLKVNPLIMLPLIAKLPIVFGPKTKISAVIRQKQGSVRSVGRSCAFGMALPAACWRVDRLGERGGAE